ncbi:uncharacterized protein A4U43_C07F26240 [Asparagus officinalis]|uniref:PUM-HD domain-containing protein n=2 Tax=Asparagus officinalis TaxID=4686 RepID=A0A5P1EGY1_ASPOF|nr:uncharacterized protein A4U43_C07F26240 [Asparagus officinalis]
MQGCISHSSGDYRTNLIAEICSNGLMLAQDAFGNYVVQYVIGLKSHSTNTILASQFQGHYVQLSMQKFSSNVVEKCFKEFHEELKAAIVFEMLAAPELEELLQHPFANYVIQSALSNTKGAAYTALVDAIRYHAAVLRTSPYCKRILALLRGKSLAF